MNADHFWKALQDTAERLRPVARSPFIPLIKLIAQWGIEVQLRFYSGQKSREAQAELKSCPPRILIYRKSASNGIMMVSPDKEYLLRPRERFSIAHELGHFLAFWNFGALPVSRESDVKEYRKQEKCMDEFAQSLLVPDWLTKLWLANVSKEEPISINSLKTWATAQCGVSGEVVAKALTKVEPSIGFLKTAEAVRVASQRRLLIVFYSSYGTELQLPNLHAFIDDESFLNKIGGLGGVGQIGMCYLGEARYEGLNVAWQQSKVPISRRRREFNSTVSLSGNAFWISVRSRQRHNEIGKEQQDQLGLFD